MKDRWAAGASLQALFCFCKSGTQSSLTTQGWPVGPGEPWNQAWGLGGCLPLGLSLWEPLLRPLSRVEGDIDPQGRGPSMQAGDASPIDQPHRLLSPSELHERADLMVPPGLIGRTGTCVPVWEPSHCAHPGSSSARTQHQRPVPRAGVGGQRRVVSRDVSGEKGSMSGAPHGGLWSPPVLRMAPMSSEAQLVGGQ